MASIDIYDINTNQLDSLTLPSSDYPGGLEFDGVYFLAFSR